MYTVKSWDGHDINDGTNYTAFIGEDAPYMAGAAAQSLERWQAWPVFAGKKLQGMRLPLLVFVEAGGALDQLKQWFAPGDVSGLKRLVIEYDSRQWYVEGVVENVELIAPGAGIHVTLAIYEPVWKTVEAHDAEVWDTGISLTKTINVSGAADALPVIKIEPIAGDGYAYRRWVKIYNTAAKDLLRYPLVINLDTAALVSAGKCQADGDDLRVWVDGLEAPRWLSGMNTTDTKIWVVLDLPAKAEMTLGTAIPGSGDVGEIALKVTTANKTILKRMPTAGIVEIDSEIFLYNGKNETQMKLLGVRRAQRGSSAAAHSAGSTVRLIPHDIWLVYGNAGVTAPDQDDAQKPLFDIAGSSNTQWEYDEGGEGFWDTTQQRSGRWTPAVLASTGKESKVYTATEGAEADPAAAMGMEANIWYKSGKVQGETCTIVWTLANPCGIGTLTASGKKQRGSTAWLALAGLQKSANGTTWSTLWTESSPGAAAAWTSWSRSAALVGAPNVRFALSGSLSGIAANKVDFEVLAVTLTVQNPPAITVGTEEGQAHLSVTIRNETTEEAITLDVPSAAAGTVTVDTVGREVIVDGRNMPGVLALDSVRQEWLRLVPGENELNVPQACGTITITWRERMP
jgi:hypothetical protein